ncbi:MAG: metallophosphoesterase [Pararhodobacter sp.]
MMHKTFTALAMAMLLGACATTAPAEAQSEPRVARFAAIGDTGSIPSYERLKPGEKPMRTLEAYLAEEAKDWLKRNPTMDGFVPTPWVFESTIGGFVNASGLYPVAYAAEEACAVYGCDFAVMLGDNVYPDGATLGADGISDERRFDDMLHRPYGSLGEGTENFSIYAMIGNHDWRVSREGAFAQVEFLDQHPNFTMPNIFYTATPPGFEGFIELFVVDTEMLLASHTVYKNLLDAEGREARDETQLESWADHYMPATDGEREMVAWLERELAASTARWKIVMGHHALWSGGGSKFEKAHTLRGLLMPAICAHADAYIAGDDHMLEVYTDDCSAVTGSARTPVPMLVSGAGGKYRPLNPQFMAHQNVNYPQMKNVWSKGSVWGFMHLELTEDKLTTKVITTPTDMSGRPILETVATFPHRRAGAAPARR